MIPTRSPGRRGIRSFAGQPARRGRTTAAGLNSSVQREGPPPCPGRAGDTVSRRPDPHATILPRIRAPCRALEATGTQLRPAADPPAAWHGRSAPPRNHRADEGALTPAGSRPWSQSSRTSSPSRGPPPASRARRGSARPARPSLAARRARRRPTSGGCGERPASRSARRRRRAPRSPRLSTTSARTGTYRPCIFSWRAPSRRSRPRVPTAW